MERLSPVHRIARFLVRFRWPLAGLAWLVMLAAGAGISQFRFTTDIHHFFDADSAQSQAFAQLEQRYGALDNTLLFVIDFGNEPVYSRANLERLRAVTDQVSDIDFVQQATSLNNVAYTAVDGDDMTVDQWFARPLALDDSTLAKRVQQARADPFLPGRLVSNDGRIATVYAEVVFPGERPVSELKQVMEQAHAIQQLLQQDHPDLTIYLSGDVVLQESLLQASSQSLTHLYPIIMLLGSAILWFYFRSVILISSGFIIVIAATAFTLGSAGWLGIVFNDTSILAIILVFIIVMADMVHINVGYLDFLHQGDDKLKAMEKSLALNLVPVLLTSVTTAIGFLCLNTCASPPLRTMGNLSSIGIVSAFFFTLLLLPAAVTLFPPRLSHRQPPFKQLMHRTANLVIRHPRSIVLVTILLALLTIPFIGLNKLHDDPISYFEKSNPLRQSMDFTAEHLGDRQQIIFSFAVNPGTSIHDPAFINQLDAFQSWLSQQPDVSHVSGYPDLIKTLNRMFNGDQTDEFVIPQDQELIAQYFLLFEMSLADPRRLTDFISTDQHAPRITVTTRPLQSEGLLDLEQRSLQWLHAHQPNMPVTVSSIDLLFAHLSVDVVESMTSGSLLAVLLIALTLLGCMGSARYGLLSLIPNVLPAAMVYGAWGLLSGKVNMAVAVTFSMSLGIIVDDTIHVLSKFQHFRRQGLAAPDAIHATFQACGAALIVTTGMIASGLLVLTQSAYGVHAIMGHVTAPIILLALALDFLLLPALLLLGSRRSDNRAKPPVPAAAALTEATH